MEMKSLKMKSLMNLEIDKSLEPKLQRIKMEIK